MSEKNSKINDMIIRRKIKKNKFSGNKKLQTIKVPNGVDVLTASCFEECTNLSSVILPEGLTKIEDGAFKGCENLEEVVIPKTVTSIGREAFKGCKSLKRIIFQEGICEIFSYAFENCSNLEEIITPNTVYRIGGCAFKGCKSLKRIILPDGLTYISSDLFNGCENLEEVVIPKSVESIKSGAFSACKSLKKIEIPESVSEIGISAFSDCSSLKNVTLPKKIDRIEDFAFYGCNELEEITFFDFVGYIGFCAIECESLKKVFMPKTTGKSNSFGIFAPNAEFYFPYSLLMNLDVTTELKSVSDVIDSLNDTTNSSDLYDNKVLDLNKVFSVFPGLDLRSFVENEEYLDRLSFWTNHFMAERLSWNYGEISNYEDLLYIEENGYFCEDEEEKVENNDDYNDIVADKVKETLEDSISDYEKRLGYIKGAILSNISEVIKGQSVVSSKIFTYEMLSKNDKANLCLSSLCDCCTKLYGEDSLAQRLISSNSSVQALAIRDVKGNIIAFGVLYVNRDEGYAVINRIEVSKKYEMNEDSIREIYTKFQQGVDSFASTYNKENRENPLKVVTCGVSIDYRAINDYIRENPLSLILSAPNINNFSCPQNNLALRGWDKEQRVIWKNDKEILRMK